MRIKKILLYVYTAIMVFAILTSLDLLFSFPIELEKNFLKATIIVIIISFLNYISNKKNK